MNKPLSSSSSLALESGFQKAASSKFFPDESFFIRPLVKKDKPAVDILLAQGGYLFEKNQPKYGIFDQDHQLVSLYSNYTVAFEDSASSEILLLWAH